MTDDVLLSFGMGRRSLHIGFRKSSVIYIVRTITLPSRFMGNMAVTVPPSNTTCLLSR